jgi:hypothetical protein
MPKALTLFALCAAFVSTPALAQLDLGLGAEAGINVGGTVGAVTGTLDRTVAAADQQVNGALALGSDVRLATRADLETGAVVRNKHGASIGILQAVHGDMAMVVKNGRTLHLPLSAIYSSASGLMTTLTKAQLEAMVSAGAHAHAHR